MYTMLFISCMIVVLSLFSTAVLSYISMAIMIGPWIESTIVLLASLLMLILAYRFSSLSKKDNLVYITAGASVGGIIATGCGFAFPTLYFLNSSLFLQWLASPLYFCCIMAGLVICAGGLGMMLANILEDRLLEQEELTFPVGELAYKLIAVQNNAKKAKQLAVGFLASALYSITAKFASWPKFIQILAPFAYKQITFCGLGIPMGELPTLCAIGFIAGHVIAIPLLVGIVINIFLLTPAHSCYFSYLKPLDFSFAFASGLVLYGALISFLDIPKLLRSVYNKTRKGNITTVYAWRLSDLIKCAFIVLCNVIFFSYFKFGIVSQLYLFVATVICAYQLALIGGKIGMAPMGKFATFVMVPGLFIFGYNAIQLTLVSTFVEIVGGVIVDILFGRKMARLAGLDRKKICSYQWLGLVVSACSIGIFFLVLIKHLGLGSEQLLAQRAHMRALLVGVQKFDFFALILGALLGALLKDLKINPIMVLGGILMPMHWSFILVVTGLATYLVKDPEIYYPFWSGTFAAHSLWMIFQVLL